MPEISVIIAAYNRSAVLRYAIESVLWQTFTDFELLVIGDHCTDDSAEVVASFHDNRIIWHNLEENTGNQAGPNDVGLKMAKGNYIAYLNQDDLWLPNHLELLLKTTKEQDADFAFTYIDCVMTADGQFRHLIGPHASDETFNPFSSVMHRRDLGLEIGAWKDYKSITLVPTVEFWQRMVKKGSRGYARIPQITVIHFPSALRPGSYLDGQAIEQARYFERIKTEKDFLQKELMSLVIAYETNKTSWKVARKKYDVRLPSFFDPPGWQIEEYRRVRGLSYNKDILNPNLGTRIYYLVTKLPAYAIYVSKKIVQKLNNILITK